MDRKETEDSSLDCKDNGFSQLNQSSSTSLNASPVLVLWREEQNVLADIQAMLSANNRNTTIRLAGGWVRDRLLGRNTTNVDLVLDDLHGGDFMSMYMTYLHQNQRFITHHRYKPFAQNKDPDMVTWEYFLTHFRTGSIPQTQTPEEYAERQDFTVNAILFNVKTNQIEDNVGGVEDLRQGIIRTPGDPKAAFQNNPVKMLRAARFAAQLGFSVHPSVVDAAKNLDDTFIQRISRESIGREFQKMMKQQCAMPWVAFQLLDEWGLSPIIFRGMESHEKDPSIEETSSIVPLTSQFFPLQEPPHLAFDILRAFLEKHGETEKLTDNFRTSVFCACLLLPFYGYRVQLQSKQWIPLIRRILTEQWRFPTVDSKRPCELLDAIDLLYRACIRYLSQQSSSNLSVVQEEKEKKEAEMESQDKTDFRILTGRALQILASLSNTSSAFLISCVSVAQTFLRVLVCKSQREEEKMGLEEYLSWLWSSHVLSSVKQQKQYFSGSDLKHMFQIKGSQIAKMLEWQKEFVWLTPNGDANTCQLFLENQLEKYPF